MPVDPGQPSCLLHAAHWRQRAAQTYRPELRTAYEQMAESYERLARQAPLCRRLVVVAAQQRGEPPRCCCDPTATAASPSPEPDPA